MARRDRETNKMLRYTHSDGGHNYTAIRMEGRNVIIKTGLGNAPRFKASQCRYIAKKLIQFAEDIERDK